MRLNFKKVHSLWRERHPTGLYWIHHGPGKGPAVSLNSRSLNSPVHPRHRWLNVRDASSRRLTRPEPVTLQKVRTRRVQRRVRRARGEENERGHDDGTRPIWANRWRTWKSCTHRGRLSPSLSRTGITKGPGVDEHQVSCLSSAAYHPGGMVCKQNISDPRRRTTQTDKEYFGGLPLVHGKSVTQAPEEPCLFLFKLSINTQQARGRTNAGFHLPLRSELGTRNDVRHELTVFQYHKVESHLSVPGTGFKKLDFSLTWITHRI